MFGPISMDHAKQQTKESVCACLYYLSQPNSVSATEKELAAATGLREELYAKQSRGSKYRTAEERDAALKTQVRCARKHCTPQERDADGTLPSCMLYETIDRSIVGCFALHTRDSVAVCLAVCLRCSVCFRG